MYNFWNLYVNDMVCIAHCVKLFSIKIHGVLGINSTVVLKLIHTMYVESVLLLSSVTCIYACFRDAPAV